MSDCPVGKTADFAEVDNSFSLNCARLYDRLCLAALLIRMQLGFFIVCRTTEKKGDKMDEKKKNNETEEEAKTDEEQTVEDTDADTKDVEDSEKTDEEQEVDDTDADTKDVAELLDKAIEDIASMRAQITSLKDSVSMFVENGGVVREEDVTFDSDNDGDADFVPIEELDLSL